MNQIGFVHPTSPPETALPPVESVDPVEPERPVRSLVEIYFPDRNLELSYYNDRFDLKDGDAVYVSGKLEGKIGIVTSVTTKFRIHLLEYQRVIAKLDVSIHGEFVQIQNRMVCFDPECLSPDRFGSWVFPPTLETDPKCPEDEVVSGEGYVIDLDDLASCPDLEDAVLWRAKDYDAGGQVRYLSRNQGHGCAFVEGTRWYRVDFRYQPDGIVTDLFCDCPYPRLCKHEAAVALSLRRLLSDPKLVQGQDFVALNRNLFWRLAAREDNVTIRL